MLKASVDFKNARKLLIQTGKAETARKVCLVPAKQVRELRKSEDALNGTLVAYDPAWLRQKPRPERAAELEDLLQRIKHWLQSEEVSLIYQPQSEADAAMFATLLISKKNATASVIRKIYKYLTEKDPSEEEVQIIDQWNTADHRPHNLTTEPIKVSFWNIRNKLLLITLSIVTGALSTLTFLATNLFIDHSETLIQDYNLSLARLTARRIERDLDVYKRDVEQYAKNPGRKEAEDYFKAKQQAAALFIAGKDKGVYGIRNLYWNESYDLNQDEIIKQTLPHFAEAFAGKLSVNSLGNTDIPLVAIAAKTGNREAAVIILASESLLSTIRSSRQTDIFTVAISDSEGSIVARTGDAEIDRHKIIEMMLASAIGNGSQKYYYNETEYMGAFQTIETGSLGIATTVETDRVFEAVYSIQRQNLIFTVAILTIAFLLIYFFARSLTNPIRKLVRAMREIEVGNYHPVLDVTGKDEIGALSTSFRQMARGLEEREKIKVAFGRFVNPAIAEKALKEDINLGGSKKNCTVLFSDLRNFTGQSEKLDPEAVVDMLNDYFTRMVGAIHENEGVVDKFIGDAVMATWGAIDNPPDAPARSVRAALAMRTALIQLNTEREAGGLGPIHAGVGINTGPVVAGQIGSIEHLEYTVIGDAVNLASRIEYLNKLFGTDILISSYTYEYVKDLFAVKAMPPIHIKGKEKPEIVYAILGNKRDPNTPKNLTGLRKLIRIEFDMEQAKKQLAVSSDSIEGEVDLE